MCFDVRKKESWPLLDAALGAGPGAAAAAGPDASEDRGTPVWVWRDEDGNHSFCRPRRSYWVWEVSVPIGCRLRPDPMEGVVLADVFGRTMDAADLLWCAQRRECGFKIRKNQEVFS